MTTIANIAQAWNGYAGQHCAAHDDRYDIVDSGFNRFLREATAIGVRERMLDLGCGKGQLTRPVARPARYGHTLGIDLPDPMHARARDRAKAENLSTVTFDRGDIPVHEFQPDAFDLALSRFGILFSADPVAAFTNIGRALHSGNQLAFVCRANLSGTDPGGGRGPRCARYC